MKSMTKRLSTGFAGGSTRGLDELDKEIEYRLGRLDRFSDEFDPPGIGEAFPGGNFQKRNGPFEDEHTDDVPEVKNRVKVTNELAAAGNAKDQEKMDWLDDAVHKEEAPIKKWSDQFPGSTLEEHMDDEIGPEEFHKNIEKKMRALSAQDAENKIAKTLAAEEANPEGVNKKRYEEEIKDPDDQHPAQHLEDGMMQRHEEEYAKELVKHLAGEVDEGLWKKAKDASQHAFGKVKWPFVQWWYKEHGGK